MILRLSSPAARILLALLASMLATALSYSGIRNALAVRETELDTPDGYQRAIRLEPDDATNWYLLGRYWQYNLEDPALAFAGITRPADPRGSLVWDGGFESNIAKGGLTWYCPTFIGGVQLTLDTKERHSGNRSLRLTFNGLRSANFNDVCQYVAVQPSTSYRFSAWVRTRDISTDEGVRFGLQSLSNSLNSMAWTDDVCGTQPWTQVKLPWTSGNDVRELHLGVSRLPSAKFPSKIGGSTWIDDVSPVPLSAENTKQ
jgi:hypothetical protein